MKSFTEIIDALGGPTAASAILGTTQQNCSQMRLNNSISARFWPAVVKACARKKIDGVSMESLAKLAAARKSTRAAS